jgi:hypothetical protein
MVCSSCGAPADNTGSFCRDCGARLYADLEEQIFSLDGAAVLVARRGVPRQQRRGRRRRRLAARLPWGSFLAVIGAAYAFSYYMDHRTGSDVVLEGRLTTTETASDDAGAQATMPAAMPEPAQAAIMFGSTNDFLKQMSDPAAIQKFGQTARGNAFLVHAVIVDGHDPSAYAGGNGGYIIGFVFGGSYLLSCQLSHADSARYIRDTDTDHGGTMIINADIWGTVEHYAPDSGFFLKPCGYKRTS